jgi:cysteine desulfurase/selenocysteine lyase
VPYFLDACQSAGQLPVDVGAISCDVATGTGRKFLRAPRGTGWFWVRPEWAERMEPPGIDTRSAESRSEERYVLGERARRFEEFETSYAARIGLGIATQYALLIGIAAIADRIGRLAEDLRDSLEGIGAAVHDGGRERCGIVTFTVPGRDPRVIRDSLSASGINVSVTDANFAPLDMASRGLRSAVRASPHVYNTDEELERLVDRVREEIDGPGSEAGPSR